MDLKNRDPSPGGEGRGSTRVMIAVLTVIAVAFFLKATASVTLPMAFALFLVALFWPLQKWMQRYIPSGLAMAVSLVVFLGVVAGFVVALGESADEVKDHAASYEDRLTSAADSVRSWAQDKGVALPSGQEIVGDVSGVLQRVSKTVFDVVGGFVLVIAFLGLLLLEVRDFEGKLERSEGSAGERWPDVMRRIGTQFQRYVVVRTGIGVITGVGTGLGALVLGLDFWWIWGLINFLLNYIPTLGSIIGVIPPVAFAFLQFGGWEMPLATLAVVGGVQLVMGNWIDPLLQGRYLSLSPFVVLLSVAFWGWVWGIPGALIGVPLTIVVVLATRESRNTRWIARMLADHPEDIAFSEEEKSDGKTDAS